MHDDRAQVEAQIRRVRREVVGPAVHGPGVEFDVEALHVAREPISVEAARAAEFEPFAIGERWGSPWGTTWFRLTATIPPDWDGLPVDAVIAFSPSVMVGFSAEAALWGPDGVVQGLHPDHRTVRIAESAGAGHRVELLVEAAANPDFSLSHAPTPLGDPATAGHDPLYRLAQAEIAVRHPEVWSLDLDMGVLGSLMSVLAADEPRRNDILHALQRSIRALDRDDVPGSAARARAELAGVLASPAAASAHCVSAVGHAHIDTAWLWPLRETRRKCARTFSTAVALMDEYPEYRFACSQAQQYEWVRQDHPALFERIRAKVDAGQWVPVGGMWVEADANIPSGESLVRQFVHGQRFFREYFGVECREVWIPDVFGYSAALPQIMRQAGCDRFVTQKLSWNDTNTIPHHTFWWEGLDGSRVLTHFPPADTYNGTVKPAELVRSVKAFRDHGDSRHSLYLFGHGDGGGGPTREMLERARRQRDLEGAPRVTIESPSEFFERVEAEPSHPVWVGELYFEKHRGTFTSQAATKAGVRRSELALREAELWACGAASDGFEYPAARLDDLWKRLLTQEFHDIIPGSSIAWVHRDAEAESAEVCSGAEQVSASALDALTSRMASRSVLVNSLTHDRREVALVPAGAELGDCPVQELADGSRAAWVEVPGMGLASPVAGAPSEPVRVDADARELGNGLISVRWDDAGRVVSVVDLAAEREVLAAPGNVLQLFEDYPLEYDAWDIDREALARHIDTASAQSVTVVDDGPLVAGILVESVVGTSKVTQLMRLRAGSARLDFVTRVDWHESERLLKAAFPVDVRAASARYEMQFGHVERPTHENTSWDWARYEVCGHTWADLSEPDFGVALMNDCKYGYDIRGSVMRLTLLRAPSYPDPRADRGVHEFTYSLYPHQGDLRRGGVVAAAHELNSPIRVVTGSGSGSRESLRMVRIEHPGIVVSAVKRADDGSGDWIVRCYEAWGQRSRSIVELAAPIRAAWRCDLHERPDLELSVEAGRSALELRPFELATLRLTTS